MDRLGSPAVQQSFSPVFYRASTPTIGPREVGRGWERLRPTLHPPTMTQTAATATATSRSATHLRPPPQQTLDFMRTRLRARLGRWTVECTLIANSTDFKTGLNAKWIFMDFDLIRFVYSRNSKIVDRRYLRPCKLELEGTSQPEPPPPSNIR